MLYREARCRADLPDMVVADLRIFEGRRLGGGPARPRRRSSRHSRYARSRSVIAWKSIHSPWGRRGEVPPPPPSRKAGGSPRAPGHVSSAGPSLNGVGPPGPPFVARGGVGPGETTERVSGKEVHLAEELPFPSRCPVLLLDHRAHVVMIGEASPPSPAIPFGEFRGACGIGRNLVAGELGGGHSPASRDRPARCWSIRRRRGRGRRGQRTARPERARRPFRPQARPS